MKAAHVLGIERNELRRTSDRIETAAKAVAYATALLAVPFALAVGASSSSEASTAAAEQIAAGASVQATVIEEPQLTTIAAGHASAVVLPTVGEVEWTVPSGATRTAAVPLRAGARPGSTVLVWLDSSGQPTTAPPTHLEQLTSGFLAGILTFGAILSGIIVALVVLRVLLDRRRFAQWAKEWERVGPEWSRPWRPRGTH